MNTTEYAPEARDALAVAETALDEAESQLTAARQEAAAALVTVAEAESAIVSEGRSPKAERAYDAASKEARMLELVVKRAENQVAAAKTQRDAARRSTARARAQGYTASNPELRFADALAPLLARAVELSREQHAVAEEMDQELRRAVAEVDAVIRDCHQAGVQSPALPPFSDLKMRALSTLRETGLVLFGQQITAHKYVETAWKMLEEYTKEYPSKEAAAAKSRVGERESIVRSCRNYIASRSRGSLILPGGRRCENAADAAHVLAELGEPIPDVLPVPTHVETPSMGSGGHSFQVG